MATTSTSLPSPTLATLPIEIQQSILSHLHISTLFTFAGTSRHNHDLTTSVLTTLHLAVFSKRVHGVLAYLNSADTSTINSPTLNFLNDQPQLNWLNLPIRLSESSASHTTTISTSTTRSTTSTTCSTHTTSTPARYRRRYAATTPTQIMPQAHRELQIHRQNAHLTTILQTPLLSHLTTLTIHTYALLSPTLSSVLSTSLPHLQHLTLNFSHPAIHDPCLPAFYWENAPSFEKEGCTAWNLLAGIGKGNKERLALTGLRTLCVRRAAVTGRQCAEWVGRNRGMGELRLEWVMGVDGEFCEGLAGLFLGEGSGEEWEGGTEEGNGDGMRAPLRRLELLNCPALELREREDFAWVEVLVTKGGLKWLDSRGCEGVDGEMLKSLFEERGWGAMGLTLAEDEDEQFLETRSLDQDMETDGTGRGEKGKGPIIEIDPNFD